MIGDDHHAAEGSVGARVPGLVEAVVGVHALRLRLGRRRVLQRPARGHGQQTAMHSGADGRHPRRDEGAHRDHRWLPGERTVIARVAARCPCPRTHDRSRARHRRRGPRLLGRRAESVPKTREQRCWVHKTANVLNKLPKGVQPKAKAMLHNTASCARAQKSWYTRLCETLRDGCGTSGICDCRARRCPRSSQSQDDRRPGGRSAGILATPRR